MRAPAGLVRRWPAERVDDLLDDGAGLLGQAQRLLAAAVGFLVAAAFLDRHAVHLDQLVDHAGGRGARAGDHRCADAVDVDGFGAQRRDRELVEITRHHDAGLGGAEAVELLADLAGQHAQVAGVDAHRTEFGARHLDGVGHSLRDVVGVDEQGGADAERVDLCLERGPLVGPVFAVVCSSVNACALVPSAGTA